MSDFIRRQQQVVAAAISDGSDHVFSDHVAGNTQFPSANSGNFRSSLDSTVPDQSYQQSGEHSGSFKSESKTGNSHFSAIDPRRSESDGESSGTPPRIRRSNINRSRSLNDLTTEELRPVMNYVDSKSSFGCASRASNIGSSELVDRKLAGTPSHILERISNRSSSLDDLTAEELRFVMDYGDSQPSLKSKSSVSNLELPKNDSIQLNQDGNSLFSSIDSINDVDSENGESVEESFHIYWSMSLTHIIDEQFRDLMIPPSQEHSDSLNKISGETGDVQRSAVARRSSELEDDETLETHAVKRSRSLNDLNEDDARFLMNFHDFQSFVRSMNARRAEYSDFSAVEPSSPVSENGDLFGTPNRYRPSNINRSSSHNDLTDEQIRFGMDSSVSQSSLQSDGTLDTWSSSRSVNFNVNFFPLSAISPATRRNMPLRVMIRSDSLVALYEQIADLTNMGSQSSIDSSSSDETSGTSREDQLARLMNRVASRQDYINWYHQNRVDLTQINLPDSHFASYIDCDCVDCMECLMYTSTTSLFSNCSSSSSEEEEDDREEESPVEGIVTIQF